MRKLYLLYLCMLSLFTLTNLSAAPNLGGKPNNAIGYDFYVAVAPNEAASYSTDVIELYISSQEHTEVDYYFAGNKLGTFTLEPFVVKTIKLDSKQCEIRNSETPLKQTYRFVSKNWPISVYEINAKGATTDGMMVLPVIAYDKEYIHCSYWENGESKYSYFKSGFIIIAAEDSTVCTITLKSAGNNTYGKTDKGRVPGESWKVTLQKGECYRVCTDAGTRGEFDISGTKVTATKPIGMVSYHERAEIPRLVPPSSRNHLVEMIPPTSAWGKEYYSLEFNRIAGGGDLFRIICKEPDTKVQTAWYDLKSGTKLGSLDTTLALSGDFVEIVDMPNGRPNNSVTSVRGTSKFIADKPIQVFQYSFSSGWDGSQECDPFYVTICSPENYCQSATFQLPANKNFDKNYFNLLAIGDTADPVNHRKLLESIKIITKTGWIPDTEYVLKRYPALETNRIPGTNVYWCRMYHLSGGAYTIKALTNFGGYIYGFGSVDGYGWPAAASFSDVGQKDTIKPKVKHSVDQCGNWTIRFTDTIQGPVRNDVNYVRQVDLGVLDSPSLMDTSFNAMIEFPGGDFGHDTVQRDYTFNVKPVNLKKDMYAIVKIADRANNVTYDTVYYYASKIELHANDTINFGKRVRPDDNHIEKRYIVNKTVKPINIYGIYLLKNINNIDSKPFKIIAGGKTLSSASSIKLASNDSIEVQIQFNAITDNLLEVDTLKIAPNCDLFYSYPVIARSVIPRISISSEVNFGKIVTGNQLSSSSKILLRNTGSDTLIVSGCNLSDNSAFKVNSAATGISFPMKIAPGKNATLTNFIIFAPMTDGKHSADLTFSHNGDHNSGDSVCVLTGESGPISLVGENKEASFKITPNPVTGEYFTVELTKEITGSEITASVIDESGKTVINYNSVQINAGKLNLNTRGLSSGNYFLKLLVEGKEIIERIVVNK